MPLSDQEIYAIAKAVGPNAFNNAPQAQPAASDGTGFERGLVQGAKGIGATLTGLGALAAGAVGAKGVEQSLLNKTQAINQSVAAAARPTDSISGVNSLGDFGRYIAHGAGELVPSALTLLTGAGAGAVAARGLAERAVGSAVARAVAEHAGTLGASAAAGAMGAGQVYPQAVQNNVEHPILNALGAGAVNAALAALPLGRAGQVLEGALPSAVGGVAKEAATQAALGGVVNTGIAAANTALGGGQIHGADLADAAVAGALGGGLLGGASKLLAKPAGASPVVVPHEEPIPPATAALHGEPTVAEPAPEVPPAVATPTDPDAVLAKLRGAYLQAAGPRPSLPDYRSAVSGLESETAADQAAQAALQTRREHIAALKQDALNNAQQAMDAAAAKQTLQGLDKTPLLPAPEPTLPLIQRFEDLDSQLRQPTRYDDLADTLGRMPKSVKEAPDVLDAIRARMTDAAETHGEDSPQFKRYADAEQAVIAHRQELGAQRDALYDYIAQRPEFAPKPEEPAVAEPAVAELAATSVNEHAAPVDPATSDAATSPADAILAQIESPAPKLTDNAPSAPTAERAANSALPEVVNENVSPAGEISPTVDASHVKTATTGVTGTATGKAVAAMEGLTRDQVEELAATGKLDGARHQNLMPGTAKQAASRVLEAMDSEPITPQTPGIKSAAQANHTVLGGLVDAEDYAGDYARPNRDVLGGLVDENDEPLYAKTATQPATQPVHVQVANEVRRLIGNGVPVAVKGRIPGGATGLFDLSRNLIQVAANAKDPLSVAHHEALHAALEKGMVSKTERTVLEKAFKPGARLYKRLESAALRYDGEHGTRVSYELSNPKEAPVYGYEFWRQGALDANGSIKRIFDKMHGMVTRVGNVVQGLGYRNAEDVMRDFDAGRMANRAPTRGPSYPVRTISQPLDAALMSRSEPKEALYLSKAATADQGVAPADEHLAQAIRATVEDPTVNVMRAMGKPFMSRVLAGVSPQLVREGISRVYHNTIGSMQSLARRDPLFRGVYTAVQDMVHARTLLQSDVDSLMQNWLRHTKVFKSDPDALVAQDKLYRGTLEGKVWTPDELRQDGLSDKAVQLYQDGRRTIDHLLSLQQEAATARVDRLWSSIEAKVREAQAALPDMRGEYQTLEGLTTRTEDQAARMRNLKRKIAAEEARVSASLSELDDLVKTQQEITKHYDALRAEGYVPLRRYGGFGVTVSYADPSAAGGARTAAHLQFSSAAEAAGVAKAIRQALGADDNFSVSHGPMAQERDATFSGVNLSQTLDLLERYGIDLDGSKQANLIKALTKADAVARNAKLHRRGVAGFTRDVVRGIAEMSTSTAHQVALSRTRGRILDAMHQPGWKADVKDTANRLLDYIQNPNEEASAWRGAASMMFLGGNISSALMQLTQLPLASAPFLYQHAGIGTVYGTLLAALRAAGTASRDKLEAAVAAGKGYKGLSDDEVQALLAAERDGTLEAQQVYQLTGISQGKLLARSTSARRLTELWMRPFALAEEANRRATFVAALRIAKKLQAEGRPLLTTNHDADGKPIVADSPAAFAADAVAATQGIYNKGNRPEWMRGAVPSVIMQYKQFPIFMTELLRLLPPKSRALFLGTAVAMGGVSGVPFADDFKNALDFVLRQFGVPANSDLAMRRTAKAITESMGLGDLSSYVMSGVFGNRANLGSILPGADALKASADASTVLSDLTGPVGSAAGMALKGTQTLLHGDGPLAALKDGIIPASGVRNLAKGVEALTTGELRDARGRLVSQVSPAEAAGQLVGFTPHGVQNDYSVLADLKENTALMNQARQRMTDDLLAGLKSRDPQEIQAAREGIAAWNQAHPDMRIVITSASIRNALRASEMDAAQRGLEMAPKVNRGAYAPLLGS